ncbi:MAG TPA: sigma factor [Polyangium sp.]|jgi:RNA polymerase sigma-70 factor (ECF subfamily)|nr:sigma factor [Polyangium sp.]
MQRDAFPKTSWTLIARAGAVSPEGRAALSSLCSLYWYPVYAFIRRRGGSADDAYDRTQSFFARLLERNDLAKADRSYGSKFRSWLLRCVKNHLINEHKHEIAESNAPSGGLVSLSADDAEERYAFEPPHKLTPDRLYERQFALSLLSRVMEKLRARYVAANKEHVFEALKGCLSGETELQPYARLAELLGMNSANAARQAAHDMRGYYKKLLRAEVADIVNSNDEAAVREELTHLLESLADSEE